MQEKRKEIRYLAKFRVYFPEFNISGYTSNISLSGCYVAVNCSVSIGLITDLLIELPVVGTIALKGYIQHLGRSNTGVGFQFVQVRFEPDQSEYYNLYSRFLKIMSQLEEVRKNYLDLVKQGLLKLHTLPSGSGEKEVI